ncbi:DUF4189 domain-containing protein [Luteibacter sp. 621]|uniref:DUF4189 domain-containing protein n=1 Tax=Luteibacter sp. 621 TaxID=3373916 RepID=UPI003D2375B8
MTKRFSLLLAFISLCVVIEAHAEGGCPPGQYPQQGQGWQACVPIPGSNQANPAPEAPKWKTNWQAIATDIPKGILGTSVMQRSQSDAEREAMNDCKKKGGTTCELQVSYGNGCLAMVTGATKFQIRKGSSKSEAEKRGMDACAEGDTKCSVYYSECSLPTQVR